MFKRLLPISVLILLSCAGQQASEKSSDSTALGSSEIEASESATSDTVENGNTDGDIFVTDALQNAISNETGQIDTVSEYGTEEKDEEEERISIDDTLYEVCGFSADGKYFSFVQLESGDGYDPKKSSVFVIDVAKNEWATKPIVFEQDFEKEGNEDFETKLMADRDKLLKKFSIDRQKNMGYDYSFKGVNPANVVIINEDRYVLDFKSNNGMIELRVKGHSKDILLQKDNKVPSSRGVVRRCRLNKAYVLGDKFAVFVEYDGPIETGFENYRYYERKNIVVTGLIPK